MVNDNEHWPEEVKFANIVIRKNGDFTPEVKKYLTKFASIAFKSMEERIVKLEDEIEKLSKNSSRLNRTG